MSNSRYLRTLSVLYKNIQALPLDPGVKGALLSKITDNCDIKFLRQFDKKLMTDELYKKLAQSSHPRSLANTVEVRTWGTTKEISTGFKNVIAQQVLGKGVGHASVAMRLKANEANQELINKYCHDNHGAMKVPYQIKQYGNELIFEVYWSFWPEGLQTLSSDIESEHSSVEYQDDVATFAVMPLELKAHYLTQKYVKNKNIPFLSSILKSDGPVIFESGVKGHRVMTLPPAAVIDASKVEQDEFRRNYLELKLKQYTLSEEISSLYTLKENYFGKEKQFNQHILQGETSIKPGSNLLTLLKRFQRELPDPHIVAQVLLHRTVSKEQAKSLVISINKLIVKKEEEKEKIVSHLSNATLLIEDDMTEINNLQSRQEESRKAIEKDTGIFAFMEKVIAVLEKASDPLQSYQLSDEERCLFEREDFLGEDVNKNIKTKFKAIADTGVLTKQKADSLLPVLSDIAQKASLRIQHESANVTSLSTQIRALHSTLGEKRKVSLEDGLHDVMHKLERNRQHQEEFEAVRVKYTQYNALQEQISSHLLVLDQVKRRIQQHQTALKQKSKKKLDKVTFSYNDNSYIITNCEEAVQLCGLIEEGIKQLQEQKAVLCNKHDREIAAPHGKKRKTAKKESAPEGIPFTFDNSDGIELHVLISDADHLQRVEQQLIERQQYLTRAKSMYLSRLTRIQMGVGGSADTLGEQRIQRGISNNAVLTGFNIEEMLKKAGPTHEKILDFYVPRFIRGIQ